ncbi:DUF4998 domain-containing protein [Chitinophaga sp. NPDC101104]|uniref:DUF4998 domain-containing protein n=1 Tax=Chitinophaga sp. NPDC101104 TaxID=3390561 RepID=UPI003D01B01C
MQKHSLIITAVAFMMAAAACTKSDKYMDYVDGIDRSYAGKVDSLRLSSGDRRIQLSWIHFADPTVENVVIYYSNSAKKDSVVLPVKRSSHPDTLSYLFPQLQEGMYNFTIYTTNMHGRRSIPVNVSGRAYGDQYRSTLLNRPVSDAEWRDDGSAYITFGTEEETAAGVELTYTKTDGKTAILKSPRGKSTIVLPEYKPGTPFAFRTMFRPDTSCIDTFYAAKETLLLKREFITPLHLKNYKRPFAIGTWDGSRWGTPADWNVNAAAKTRNGGFGGFDNLAEAATFGFEKWDGEPVISNGKAWQTITLPAGKYELRVNLGAGEWYLGTLGGDARYMAVATGNSLPDYDKMSTALAYKNFSGENDRSLQFTLAQPTTLSVGFVMNWQSWGAQYFRMENLHIIHYPQ